MTARVSGVMSRTGHSGEMVARRGAAVPSAGVGRVRGSLWERLASHSRRVAMDAQQAESEALAALAFAPVPAIADARTDAAALDAIAVILRDWNGQDTPRDLHTLLAVEELVNETSRATK